MHLFETHGTSVFRCLKRPSTVSVGARVLPDISASKQTSWTRSQRAATSGTAKEPRGPLWGPGVCMASNINYKKETSFGHHAGRQKIDFVTEPSPSLNFNSSKQ